MTTDINDLIPSYPCGNCGKELGKSYAWMKSHNHFVCDCGARNEWFPDDIEELVQGIMKFREDGRALLRQLKKK